MDKDALDALRIDRNAAPEPGGRRGWLIGLGVLIVLAGGAAAWWFLHARAVPVQTVMVEVSAPAGNSGGAGAAVLNASGYVVAQQQATVSSQITGMVRKVLVEAGDHVMQDQVVATLDDAAEQARVGQAEKQLAADRAQVAQARAKVAQAELTFNRNRDLAKSKLVSQADFDQARADLKVARAGLAYAEGIVEFDQSSLHAARIQKDYTVIRAPFTGVVTEKYAHPGEMISPAAVGGFTKTGICDLVDMRSLEVDVDVNEAYIQRVRQGMRVEAVLDAYPNWRIPAHVISIVPTANKEKATVEVRIAFNKLDPRILPQMGVQVWFYESGQHTRQAGAAQPATVRVATRAVRTDGDQQYVFVVRDGHAHKQTVRTRGATAGQALVLSGLNGGETVVVSAAQTLKDGEAVEEKQP